MPDLRQAAQKLSNARHIAVLTGAGISKESGIPTFRDAQTGLWAKFNPEELASPQGFKKDPATVWQWYDYRRNKVWTVEPNPGHHALVKLEQRQQAKGGQFTLVTQNIDNLHQRAGSGHVLELHGNIFRYKRLNDNVLVDKAVVEASEECPPRCPETGSMIRPDVVWFGEMLPERILQAAFSAAEACDVMLIVGTSGVVHPAASIPVAASRNGAYIVEINPEPSALTPMVDSFLQGASGIILPELLAALNTEDS